MNASTEVSSSRTKIIIPSPTKITKELNKLSYQNIIIHLGIGSCSFENHLPLINVSLANVTSVTKINGSKRNLSLSYLSIN